MAKKPRVIKVIGVPASEGPRQERIDAIGDLPKTVKSLW